MNAEPSLPEPDPTAAVRSSASAWDDFHALEEAGEPPDTPAWIEAASPLWPADVEAAFAPLGPLARADEGFRPRREQTQMAQAVAHAIATRGELVVEAGTGVGKTFAYLVPALLSGRRTLISTATKGLQDQLFLRDLPRLLKALALPRSVALLKGRSSYLCLQRLALARHSIPASDVWALRALPKIERWALATSSGDMGEVDGLDERSTVLPWVTSTRDNCLGTECPEHRRCHVVQARREAMMADVVVVNHHLFFADMALRDTGVAELLPSVEVALFDEAHQLIEAGVSFLGQSLGSSQWMDVARDVLASGLEHARGLADWPALHEGMERAARHMLLASAGPLPERSIGSKLAWAERAEQPDFLAAQSSLQAAIAAVVQALEGLEEASLELQKALERARALEAMLDHFSSPTTLDHVRFIDISTHQVRWVESPLDIGAALGEQRRSSPKAWVFTSATLGDDEDLSWFVEATGLQQAQVLRLGSPFDYAAHARLYVPSGMPKPADPVHPQAVAALSARLARSLGGRTFVLTTTLRALKQVTEGLRAAFEAEGDDIEVLMQGEASKRQLLERFMAQPRSVLVGSHSFWEGIDAPGDALQCVVIDKLPFPPPNDPLVQARVQRLESTGRDPFRDYFLAEAAVALKQGAGRLIRTETDRGLLVVCDPRMASMGYGRRLIKALPAMTRLNDEAAALQWLEELAASRPAG